MWEFYLAVSEASFRHLDSVVYQIQMAKRRDAVPLVRDYLYAPDSRPELRFVSGRSDPRAA